MRRRFLLAGGVAAALVLWWLSGSEPADSKLDDPSQPRDRTAGELRDVLGGRKGGFRLGTTGQDRIRQDGLVQITGAVIDRLSNDHVGEVEVVFRGPSGEESVTAGADGSYRIELAPGAYRAFVRDDSVLSIGFPVEERLPGFPDLDAIGAPDEAAMPLIIAQQDLEQVDLFVLRGGMIYGHVRDGAGRPIAHAIVRSLQSEKRVRPALGSDIVETDAEGRYELRLPAGEWYLEVSHARFAGLENDTSVSLSANEMVEVDLTAVAGCVIAGKVLGPDGLPAGDGALELGYEGGFSPAGKIHRDGTFRWTTVATQEIRLRAWPWKSPPSTEQSFECREGARYNVVFRIPQRGPDIAGVLVDASGAPVPLAFMDLAPLDDNGISQQERSGGDGNWGVFSMPAGRYQLTAYAPGRGVISTVVTSPSNGVRLQLGGTGAAVGTVTGFTTGSLEVVITGCTIDGDAIKISEDARLISVRDGKFSLTALPACDLTARAKWRDVVRPLRFTVTAGGSTQVALDFENDVPAIDPDDEPFDDPEGVEPDDDPTIN